MDAAVCIHVRLVVPRRRHAQRPPAGVGTGDALARARPQRGAERRRPVPQQRRVGHVVERVHPAVAVDRDQFVVVDRDPHEDPSKAVRQRRVSPRFDVLAAARPRPGDQGAVDEREIPEPVELRGLRPQLDRRGGGDTDGLRKQSEPVPSARRRRSRRELSGSERHAGRGGGGAGRGSRGHERRHRGRTGERPEETAPARGRASVAIAHAIHIPQNPPRPEQYSLRT